MKKLLHCIVASCMASLLITGVSFAGARTGDRDGGTADQDRDRDRDGTCLDAGRQENGNYPFFVLDGAGTGDRDGTPDQDRDQARDGSCQD